MIELTCAGCEHTFTRPKYIYDRGVREGRKQFCSTKCHRDSMQRESVPAIPWLRPRTMNEQMLAEMIAGAAIEFQHCLPDRFDRERPGQHVGIDYWSGYWAALIDYGRRIFNARDYYGPGGERAYRMGESVDDQESTASNDDEDAAIPEEALSCV